MTLSDMRLFTVLVVDREWTTHIVRVSATSPERAADEALANLAQALCEDDEPLPDDPALREDVENERWLEQEMWIDDVHLLEVWEGHHHDAPSTPPALREGEVPSRPQPGEALEVLGRRARVARPDEAAEILRGYPMANDRQAAFLVPVVFLDGPPPPAGPRGGWVSVSKPWGRAIYREAEPALAESS